MCVSRIGGSRAYLLGNLNSLLKELKLQQLQIYSLSPINAALYIFQVGPFEQSEIRDKLS